MEKRQAFMNNPYHAGFEGNDVRDPYGAGIKSKPMANSKGFKPSGQIQTQEDALKVLSDMM